MANDSGDWGACNGGELTGLSRRLNAQHARKTQSRVAGGLLAASLAFLALAYVPSVLQGDTPEMIGCTECVALMPAYQRHVAGLEEMAAEDYEAVKRHLEFCPKCQDHYEEEFSIVALAGEAISWLKSTWLAPGLAG